MSFQRALTATASIFSAQSLGPPCYPPHIMVCELTPSIRCVGIDTPSISIRGIHGSLKVARVVEQLRQSNASVPSLRETRGLWVARIKGRRGIVRRENHECLEETDDRVLPLLRKPGKGI